MSDLKPLNEITEPDKRNIYFVITNSMGKARKLTLNEIYEEVDRIQLHNKVPEHIKDHFLQAKHLAIYSWFYNPFMGTALLLGLIALDYALISKKGKKAPLKNMIREAVEKGWIKDEGFSIAKIRDKKKVPYVETLITVIPALRNKLAHGSNMDTSSISSLLTCAEFINQLF
ncbi:MAG: hypothetical protein PHV30_10455 [Candidatus Margulisbacteria bacterium]|nr:hypothetical protein [Candidatus Margulisiibacteriota bacterium]